MMHVPLSQCLAATRRRMIPVTVGRNSFLLDGYHRAVAFWWFARPGATMNAYVPDRASRFF